MQCVARNRESYVVPISPHQRLRRRRPRRAAGGGSEGFGGGGGCGDDERGWWRRWRRRRRRSPAQTSCLLLLISKSVAMAIAAATASTWRIVTDEMSKALSQSCSCGPFHIFKKIMDHKVHFQCFYKLVLNLNLLQTKCFSRNKLKCPYLCSVWSATSFTEFSPSLRPMGLTNERKSSFSLNKVSKSCSAKPTLGENFVWSLKAPHSFFVVMNLLSCKRRFSFPERKREGENKREREWLTTKLQVYNF